MIPKSGNRFSDKIMLKTKNPAREQQPGVAYGTPSSNFRSRRRPRPVWAGRRRYIICCTAVESFGQALSRELRSRGSERAIRRGLSSQFLKVGHLPFASAHAQTIT